MEAIRELKEWAPLTHLLGKVPAKFIRNLFSNELNITCISVIPEFIALGTNAGIVFWYNRSNGDLQKLQTETQSPITCLHVVSSVEYMVAAGSDCGQICVFQIQKEHPADLNLTMPLTKYRPIERYTIKNMHRDTIRCVCWSKNGMRVFSGDRTGSVVITEFDFSLHLSKSAEILNESYDIVQLEFRQPCWLLVSSVYRTIICEKPVDSSSDWKVTQIGKKDRKVLSDFGATFFGPSRSPSILCVRPGFRFWIADTTGNVLKTILLKDAVERLNQSTFEVPLLNPGRQHIQAPVNFGRCLMFSEHIVVTYNANCIYFLHLELQKVVASVRRLREIANICVHSGELFVLEGTRNVIRLSNVPGLIESSVHAEGNASFICNAPLEYLADETVVSAEECFELPAIECLQLDTPLHTSFDEHDLLQQEKIYLEHSRKVEQFDKINDVEYDDSILYKQSTTKKKSVKLKRPVPSGIVEIGQQAVMAEPKGADSGKDVNNGRNDLKTEPTAELPSLRQPDVSASSKMATAASSSNYPTTNVSIFKYPSAAPHYLPHLCDDLYEPRHTTPLKKLYFIQDDEPDTPPPPPPPPSAPPVLDGPAKNSSAFLISGVPELTFVPTCISVPNLWNVDIVNIPNELAACSDATTDVADEADNEQMSSLTSEGFVIVDL